MNPTIYLELLKALLLPDFAHMSSRSLQSAINRVLFLDIHAPPKRYTAPQIKLEGPLGDEHCEVVFHFDDGRWCRIYSPDAPRSAKFVNGMKQAVYEIGTPADNDLFTLPGAVIHIFDDGHRFEVSIFYRPVEDAAPANAPAAESVPSSARAREATTQQPTAQ